MSHEGSADQGPIPDVAYTLRMSGEIHDWLTDLRSSDQPAPRRVRAGEAPEATAHTYEDLPEL